jgi:flagellar assembly protein FliH
LEAEEKLHSAIQALGSGLEQISCLRKSLLTKSKEDMVRLIMAVVKQVIHTDIEENKGIIVKTVIKTLESAVPADQYYIRVHPKDLNIVTENEPLFLAGMKGLKNIYFLADETISRGGCLAESQVEEVDATIDSQLKEIYEHLRKEIL